MQTNQLRVTAISGGLKKLFADDLSPYWTARDAWELNSASDLSVGDFLLIFPREIIIATGESTFSLEYFASQDLDYPQGFSNSDFFADIKVTALSGTPRILRGSNAPYENYPISSVYANLNSELASIGDSVYRQDLLSCQNSAKFSIEISYVDNIQRYEKTFFHPWRFFA